MNSFPTGFSLVGPTSVRPTSHQEPENVVIPGNNHKNRGAGQGYELLSGWHRLQQTYMTKNTGSPGFRAIWSRGVPWGAAPKTAAPDVCKGSLLGNSGALEHSKGRAWRWRLSVCIPREHSNLWACREPGPAPRWHQVKLRPSIGTHRCDCALPAGKETAFTSSAFQSAQNNICFIFYEVSLVLWV